MPINATYEQILSMVKQLPRQQKIKLSKELEKEAIESKLLHVLGVFKTNELDLETIKQETEMVRQAIYDKQKSHF